MKAKLDDFSSLYLLVTKRLFRNYTPTYTQNKLRFFINTYNFSFLILTDFSFLDLDT